MVQLHSLGDPRVLTIVTMIMQLMVLSFVEARVQSLLITRLKSGWFRFIQLFFLLTKVFHLRSPTIHVVCVQSFQALSLQLAFLQKKGRLGGG
jgi:hypothetical protein